MTTEILDCDVLIVGGGVGGMTLAQWLSGLGYRWALLERNERIGGPLAGSDYPLKWIPGFVQISGREYMALLQAALPVAPMFTGDELDTVRRDGHFIATTRQGRGVRARVLAFACGADVRSPYPPSPRLLVGASLAALARMQRGDRVAVLGGGDNALEHAEILADRGCQVSLLARAALKGSALLRRRVRSNPAIRITEHAGELLPVMSGNTLSIQGVEYDYGCVFYGYEPSPALHRFPALLCGGLPDEAAGVFWLGDMTSPAFASVLLTQGEAAVVARKIDHYLQAISCEAG